MVVNNQKTDKDGGILILDVTNNDVNFVLINLLIMLIQKRNKFLF